MNDHATERENDAIQTTSSSTSGFSVLSPEDASTPKGGAVWESQARVCYFFSSVHSTWMLMLYILHINFTHFGIIKKVVYLIVSSLFLYSRVTVVT